MTPRETAVLRDRVARARAQQEKERATVRETRFTVAQHDAGNRALAALQEAEQCRSREKPEKPAPPVRRKRACVYCGDLTKHQPRNPRIPITCLSHRDLPELDPFFAEAFA